MALSMEVGLGPVHIVLDGDTDPLPQKRGQSPEFSENILVVVVVMVLLLPRNVHTCTYFSTTYVWLLQML